MQRKIMYFFDEQTMDFKKFLYANGIKQRWLANQLKISESMLSLILNNKRSWQTIYIDKLSKVLGLKEKEIRQIVGSEVNG